MLKEALKDKKKSTTKCCVTIKLTEDCRELEINL